MDKFEINKPIQIILDGPNHVLWAQAMHNFLKGQMVWRYVTSDISKPTKKVAETDDKFAKRLEEWDSKNH